MRNQRNDRGSALIMASEIWICNFKFLLVHTSSQHGWPLSTSTVELFVIIHGHQFCCQIRRLMLKTESETLYQLISIICNIIDSRNTKALADVSGLFTRTRGRGCATQTWIGGKVVVECLFTWTLSVHNLHPFWRVILSNMEMFYQISRETLFTSSWQGNNNFGQKSKKFFWKILS